jgi:pimeloyl-ACP methyl ester carboxylesterase
LRYSESVMTVASVRWKKVAISAAGAALLFYLACAAAIYFYGPHLIFVPLKSVADTPANHGAQFLAIRIPIARSDAELSAWWLPADAKLAQPDRVKVLLYLHGNYGNIGDNAAHAARLSRYGVNVLIPDYRGFGESAGPFPSEDQVYEDAETAWQWLLREKHYTPAEIVIYGHSLGGAIAIELASHHPEAAGLIVESSFTSVAEMAQLNSRFRILPMSLLVTQRFDSLGRVGSLKMPVLLIHGDKDRVVPLFMAQRLYDSAPGPKTLVVIPGGGHDNCATVGSEQYVAAVRKFVTGLQ